MKVVFVQAYYKNSWESLAIGYIASYARKNYQGDLDMSFYHGNFDSDATIIADAQHADIVAFTCTSPTWAPSIRLATAIKKLNPKVHIVVGGFHVSALKERIFETNPPIDQIVVGKGEWGFTEILKGNRQRILHSMKLPFDQLPWPDRDLIKNERTIQLCQDMIGKRITSFSSIQVCSLNCIFCSESSMTGKMNKISNPLLIRNVKDTLDEIGVVTEKYGLDEFKFVDATWDISTEYVVEFCKEKIARGNTTPWEALVHVAFTSEEMFEWMAKANVYQINVGCESGSDRILRYIGKGASREKIKRTFAMAKKYGIRRRGFFILGMPPETEEDMKLTESMIDEMEPDQVGFTINCVYPQAPGKLYDHEKYKHIDYENTDEYSNDFWFTEHFTNAQLKEKQAYFVNKYKDIACERQQDVTELRKYQTTLPERLSYPGNFMD